MTKENFLKRYEKYDAKVQEYMKIFSDELERKYQEIPEVFIITLDIIAGNLVIMVEAMNDIVSGKVGIVGHDEYRGDKKSTELSAFLASQNNVAKLVDKFGWTPSGKSKIREANAAEDVKKVLDNLLS